MKKPFVLLVELWKKQIGLCWGWSEKEFSDYLRKLGEDEYEIIPRTSGQTVKTKGGGLLIWVSECDAILMLKILNHEILHAVFFIMRDKGVIYSWESEETFTYTQEYIQDKLYKYIKLEPNITIKTGNNP